jgi:hypothetical protein
MSLQLDNNTLKSSLLLLFIVSVLGLQACGIPEDRGGTDGSIGASIDSDRGTNENNTILGKTAIINVEQINGDDTADIGQISLVALNEKFEESDANLPIWEVARSKSSNNIELYIDSDYNEQVNHVIKFRLNSDEFYYAPIPFIPDQINSTTAINVNIYTHYTVKKLFDLINLESTLNINAEDRLNQLLPCDSSSPIIGCENQPRAKQDYFSLISRNASNNNLEIDSAFTISAALEHLDTELSFKTHVETAINELIRSQSPFAKGTMRESSSFGLNDQGETFILPPPWSKKYNSALFAITLSEQNPNAEAEQKSVLFGAASSTVIESKDLQNDLPAYPQYVQTTYLSDIRRESSLSIDIPFTRSKLSVSDIDNYTLNRDEPINSYASAESIDSFLSTEGFILDARTIDTSQPGDTGDIKDVAWQFEPLFSKTYQVNEYEPDSLFVTPDPEAAEDEIDFGVAPTWLTSASFSKAANYTVNFLDDDTEELGAQLEDINLFSWELHSLETDTDFNIGSLNGKEYGVISYALKMNNQTKVLEIFGETMKWDNSSSLFNISQPALPIGKPHYLSYTIARNANNSIENLTEKTGIVENQRSVFTVDTVTADTSADSGISEQNRGILKLDGGTEAPIGHSTQDGSYLAFTFDTSVTADPADRGHGIIIATELSSSFTPVFNQSEEEQYIYQLQGNSFGILAEQNSLTNINGSSLQIASQTSQDDLGGACIATLKLQRISVVHTINTDKNELSSPTNGEALTIESTSCQVNQNEINISFENIVNTNPDTPQEQDITLKGFITQAGDGTNASLPGNLITLLWLQEDKIGLVFANKQQSLNPSFD